jgi:cytochrome c553
MPFMTSHFHRMPRQWPMLLVATVAAGPLAAEEQGQLERTFEELAKPFLQTYCHSCHGGETTKADLDLTLFNSVSAIEGNLLLWEIVEEQIEEAVMPPRKATHQPSVEERAALIGWLHDLRQDVATRNAGDPGPVLARRLSNAEFDYSVRDLTGVDIRPAGEFPVDPANVAGFNNTGESLTMSPALLGKYLDAAKRVAEHLVLTPYGLEFAEHPAIVDTDRDKHWVRKIIAFYRGQRTDLRDYFAAAWSYRQTRSEWSVADLAKSEGLSAKYLATVITALEEEAGGIGPLAALSAMLRELPETATPPQVDETCTRMRDLAHGIRARVKVEVPHLSVKGMNNGAQPLVLWRNREMVAARRQYGGGALAMNLAKLAEGTVGEPALRVPEDDQDRQRYEDAVRRFCSVVPDEFYVAERGRSYLENGEDPANTGRYLSAGLHNQMGYFRDDQALYELILDEKGQRELDVLWESFFYSSSIPQRMHSGHIWHERAESGFIRGEAFEFARPEDKDIVAEPKFSRFAKLYLERVRRATSDEIVIQAVEDYFTISEQTIRKVEMAEEMAQSLHVAALATLAERAWRRPLDDQEKANIADFYHALRTSENMTHEHAVRDTVASLLISPHFCYRIDLGVDDNGTTGSGMQPLSNYELASRLSYFLWSSLPDRTLLDSAAAGELTDPVVLRGHVARMLQDDKIRGFATEFAGSWLDFRRFEEHNAVDREHFPMFDHALRQAMFEEPVRLIEDIVKNDRPITELLEAKHTFVNGPLAKHYGMDAPKNPEEWIRAENADAYGRGGILPMAVFLTKNAPGLRTSPVKRGYWVARRILGEHIPAPPPDVPELPGSEAEAGELTLRQALEKHREDPNCTACHARFDSFGLVFEGYGPVGERRTLDLGGRPVDSSAEFPGGGVGSGIEGLREYLREQRHDDFINHFCRMLLSYALSRSLIASDDALLTEMRTCLSSHSYRCSSIIEVIVTSPQFLNKRSHQFDSDR